ncbi:MAG TPA: hypothetical protein VFI40_13910 [Nocardioides sp.]|nr:hypothetical protein [Nocardioides sp.]
MKDQFRVSSAGHGLSCFVCRSDTFDRRTMTLLTSGIANSGFNKRGEIAICATCGYVHTFMAGTRLDWRPVEDPS